LNTPTYIASPDFLSHIVWVKAPTGSHNDLMITRGNINEAPSDLATCAVIGTVSPTRLFLEPHGNFNPMFENSMLESSKFQFQLLSPVIHPEITDDFNLGMKNIESLQNKAFNHGPNPEHFIVTDGQAKALKFSSPLFQKRVCSFMVSIVAHALIMMQII
jgi:hypothetical protein